MDNFRRRGNKVHFLQGHRPLALLWIVCSACGLGLLWLCSQNFQGFSILETYHYDLLNVHLPRKFFIGSDRDNTLKTRYSQTEMIDALKVDFKRQWVETIYQLPSKVNQRSHLKRSKKRYRKHTLIEILDVFHPKKNADPGVNCSALFLNDVRAIQNSLQKKKSERRGVGLTINACDVFKRERGYIENYLSEVERDFPIAFSIMVYKDAEQMEHLLKTIYRPQNYYCIHVDQKSDSKVRSFVTSVAKCFINVFLSSSSVPVSRGTYSVLEADLICLNDLLKLKKWKYFINLTGHEFPLKTNFELVKILKAYNGSNDLKQSLKGRSDDWIKKTETAPYGLKVWKGTTHVVISRAFAEFTMYHTYGIEFLNWTKQFQYPDEIFFSSLSVPGVAAPGAYTGDSEEDPLKKPFLARYMVKNKDGHSCGGKWYNQYCVFGVKDLPTLKQRRELFANKFFRNEQPHVLECMEELILNRTRDYYYEILEFNDTYYKQLDFVINKV